MTLEEIVSHSNKIKMQADYIMESTNLISTLGAFGNVFVHGSYPLNIMYGPDIDIVVTTDDIRNASLDAFKKLVELRQFQKFEYGDFVKFPREKRPQGYIIVFKTTVEDIKWEIEIWFLNSSAKERENFEWLKERINENTRKEILKAKHLREATGKTKHQLSSHELYKQILS